MRKPDIFTRVVKFHYFSGTSISAKLIKWRLGDGDHHVGIELDDGSFIDSTLRHGGVKFRQREATPSHTDVFYVDVNVYEELLEYIKKVDGKVKYDKLALLGFGLGNKTQNDKALFCSEFGELCYEILTGLKIQKNSMTTPEDLRIATSTYAALAFGQK